MAILVLKDMAVKLHGFSEIWLMAEWILKDMAV
jgi:hypothetical protein